MSAFSSVILTFVFATYLTTAVAAGDLTDPMEVEAAQARGAQVLSAAQAWGALAVALLAPLLGNLADSGRARNPLLRITTLATVLVIALMPLIAPDRSLLWPGAILIALAVVLSELAGVFVNSVLPEISTVENRGRVSGTAWAVGYWGSILALVVVLLGFVMPGSGLLGITAERAWNIRAIPLFVAVWILVLTLPLMLRAPRHRGRDTTPGADRWTPWQGYAQIGRHLARSWREDRILLWYLVASAIYRDGLGAVFALAGVLAATAYGFSTPEVILFGIVANLAAGMGVFLGGRADDRFGPRRVIIVGTLAIIVLGLVVLVLPQKAVFWVMGVLISCFVGPVQSASRSLLSRMSRPGREAEDFGLYATTGRALGFLGTGAFSVAVALTGVPRQGFLGILVVLLVGLLAFLPIPLGAAGRSGRESGAAGDASVR
ncbi:MFS transporter [Brachybacterium sp. EF45031]|nr:MFS transporter [Brachybacterium sillae]